MLGKPQGKRPLARPRLGSEDDLKIGWYGQDESSHMLSLLSRADLLDTTARSKRRQLSSTAKE
jgi:hypothetical protein